jgi:two-component system, chemotaxis family, chemotaxis protein CheY
MGLNILIVDDSAVMRKIIKRAIEEGKYADAAITEAGDGVEALKVFNPGRTDLILSDWNMPNMDGLEFVKKVRAIKTKKKIVVIMITTEGSTGKMEEAMDNGVDNYITKPFTSIALEKKIDRCFGA